MKNKITKFAFIAAGFTAVCSAILPISASASGFYVGADIVMRTTDLDYDYGPDAFTTSHFRVKGGYEFIKNLAAEVHVMTAGSSSQMAGPYTLDKYEFDTGTIVGVYFKPKTSFAKANVYGVLGIALWDTTYTHVNTGTSSTDDVVMIGVGVGGEFNMTRNLRFHVEGMVQTGSADYGSGVDPTLNSANIAIGFSYQF